MRLMLRGFRRIGQAVSQAEPCGDLAVLQLRQSRALAVEGHHQALGVGHPGQALEQAHRAAEATEQVPREHEFEREHDAADDDEARLVGRQRAADEVAPDLARRQQVAQQRDRPQEAEDRAGEEEGRPPAPVGLLAGAQRALPVPEAELAAGALQQRVERFDQREMRAQPAAVEAAVAVGHRHEGDHQQHAGQDGAQHDVQRHLRGADAMLRELVDAERPAMAQHPQLRLVEIEAQQVECGREQEEREEADLQRAAQALQARHALRLRRIIHRQREGAFSHRRSRPPPLRRARARYRRRR